MSEPTTARDDEGPDLMAALRASLSSSSVPAAEADNAGEARRCDLACITREEACPFSDCPAPAIDANGRPAVSPGGQADEALREALEVALVRGVGVQLPPGYVWRPGEALEPILRELAPLLADRQTVQRVQALANRWDSSHPKGCCASGTCGLPDGQHTDPTDPIDPSELLGIFSDNPPPLREHRKIPCPRPCICKVGPFTADLRRALDDTP